jgi:hypothetical protein
MSVFLRGVQLRCGPPGAKGLAFGNEAPGVTGHHVKFSTKASDTGRPATCVVQIYNISDTSLHVFEDSKNVATLLVGHADRGMSALFKGNPLPNTLTMSRQGGDWVTSVTLRDGGRKLDFGRLDVSFTTTTTGRQVLDRIISETGLGRGQIDLGVVNFPRRFVFSGSASQALDLLVGATATDPQPRRWFVRDGDLYILPSTTPTAEKAVVYSADNGTLVGSPTAGEDGSIQFKGVLVDTTLRVGRVVKLVSRRFSGFYKAVDVSFSGTNYDSSFYVTIKAVPYQ